MQTYKNNIDLNKNLEKTTIEFFNKLDDNEVIKLLGDFYVNGKIESENNKKVEDSFRIMAQINHEIFKEIPYKVIFTEKDVYKSAREMRERVVEENVMYIYTGNSEHQFLTEQENWEFRAVHDVFAHMVCGCPFTFKGEFNAYLEQRKLYPKSIWGVLFGEIPMQTSAYYYKGSFDFKQRAIEAHPDLVKYFEERFVHDYSKYSVLKPFVK